MQNNRQTTYRHAKHANNMQATCKWHTKKQANMQTAYKHQTHDAQTMCKTTNTMRCKWHAHNIQPTHIMTRKTIDKQHTHTNAKLHSNDTQTKCKATWKQAKWHANDTQTNKQTHKQCTNNTQMTSNRYTTCKRHANTTHTSHKRCPNKINNKCSNSVVEVWKFKSSTFQKFEVSRSLFCSTRLH